MKEEKKKMTEKFWVVLLKRLIPVSKARLESEVKKVDAHYAKHINRLIKQHSIEIEEAKKLADKVIERCCDIQFNHYMDEHYSVTTSFSTRMVVGAPREELQFIAERIGRMVAAEIAAAKFVRPHLEGNLNAYSKGI